MIKNLIKVANRLDSLGLTKEADLLDGIIKKIALTEEDFSKGGMKLTISIEPTRHPDAESLLGSQERQLRARLNELLIDGPSKAHHMGTHGMEGQIESSQLLTFNSIGPLDEKSRPGKNPESFSVKFDPINSENRSYKANIKYVFDIPFGYSDEAKKEGIKWIVQSAEMALELALADVTAERGTNWRDYFVVASRISL